MNNNLTNEEKINVEVTKQELQERLGTIKIKSINNTNCELITYELKNSNDSESKISMDNLLDKELQIIFDEIFNKPMQLDRKREIVIKKEIYSSYLTGKQRIILEEWLKGQDVENINIDEALCNLNLIEGEEKFLEGFVLSEERQYTYNQVRRCINSFEDYEVREEMVLQEAKKIFEAIRYEEMKLEYLAIDCGFTTSEMHNIIDREIIW